MAENRAHDSHAYTRRGIASRFLRFFAVLRIASQADPWKCWFDNRRRTRCVVCLLRMDQTNLKEGVTQTGRSLRRTF